MPAPKPNTLGDNPRFLFMASAAKPMVARSLNETKKNSITKGTMRGVILRSTRVFSSALIEWAPRLIAFDFRAIWRGERPRCDRNRRDSIGSLLYKEMI